MCGFAGVVAWDDRYRCSRDALARLSAAIAHRGPDGEGLWLSHDDGETSRDRPHVALAHRRLAILDPDPRSDQPFTDDRGRWLVFNGEIYNFRELRRELEPLLPDWRWRTTGDTEVLLASFAAWGPACVERLRGMFAFFAYDATTSAWLLARDRMGQKPLYVAHVRPDIDPDQAAHTGDPLLAIAFASDLSALKTLPWVDLGVRDAAVDEYLRWGYLTAPSTVYEGAGEMYPGSVDAGRRDTHGTTFYFSAHRPLRAVPPPIDDASAVERTREEVERATREQMIADVPIGCFLSGGIDSSIVALCMTRAAARAADVRTFSIGFDDPRYDESGYAAEVARRLGTTHERLVVRPDVAGSLPELAAAFGQPFGDSSALPTYWLSKLTRERVKVALSGDGGDELFGGYDRYRAIRLVHRLQSRLGPIPGALGTAARLFGGGHPKSRLARLARLGDAMRLPAAQAYSRMTRLFTDEQVYELRHGAPPGPGVRSVDDAVADALSRPIVPGDVVRTALAVDRGRYLPGDLLTKVDRASMRHNLEVRSPFMDHELVRFAFALTTPQLLQGGGKRMLREAFAADLPATVFTRQKMGFAVPIGQWFRTDPTLKAMLIDHLTATDSFARAHFAPRAVQRFVDEHLAERVDHTQRLYALLMLELWWRTRAR